jgi:retron-type reverse transcriptase
MDLSKTFEEQGHPLKPLVKPLLADEKLKEIFIEIVLSNYRLGCAEYNRNPAYNDTHYHYKAEEKMMYYLQDNYPELWKEIGKRILEIDSKQSV